jgi:hypothetical protein
MIEVGEYCRNAEGLIFKVDKEKKNLLINDFLNMGNRDIVKHSKNIIDLIEVGDFVNGVRVGQSYLCNIKYLTKEIVEKNYGIKTILTHEMYEQNCYKIGD